MKSAKILFVLIVSFIWIISLFYFSSLTYNPFIIRYEDFVEEKDELSIIHSIPIEDPGIQRFYYTDRKKDEEPINLFLENYEPFNLHLYLLLQKSGPEDSTGSYVFGANCSDEYERQLYGESIGSEIDENESILFNCPGETRFHSSSIGSVWARYWEDYEDIYTGNQMLKSPEYKEQISNDNYNYIISNETLGKSVFVLGDEKGKLYDNLFLKYKAYLTVITEYSDYSIKSFFTPLFISVIGVTLPLILLLLLGVFELVNKLRK